MTTAKNNNRKMAYRIIILGGYGNFGARVARALASEPNIELIVAGRDLGSASRFVRTIGGAGAASEATRLDHTAYDFPANLHALPPNLVSHRPGPFRGRTFTSSASPPPPARLSPSLP